MDDFFRKLEDAEYFRQFVTGYFENVPHEMADILECLVTVDAARVEYAHGEYIQNIEKFALLLDSADPDHYKRAGALLHALYQANAITDVSFVADLDEIECGMGPVQIHVADVQNGLDFARFYDEYHNEMIAFIFAFQCCAAYEPEECRYDFDYLRTMCVYMGKNSSLSLETFFMLFKSLMYR